jgi:hypothetical protein
VLNHPAIQYCHEHQSVIHVPAMFKQHYFSHSVIRNSRSCLSVTTMLGDLSHVPIYEVSTGKALEHSVPKSGRTTHQRLQPTYARTLSQASTALPDKYWAFFQPWVTAQRLQHRSTSKFGFGVIRF